MVLSNASSIESPSSSKSLSAHSAIRLNFLFTYLLKSLSGSSFKKSIISFRSLIMLPSDFTSFPLSKDSISFFFSSLGANLSSSLSSSRSCSSSLSFLLFFFLLEPFILSKFILGISSSLFFFLPKKGNAIKTPLEAIIKQSKLQIPPKYNQHDFAWFSLILIIWS